MYSTLTRDFVGLTLRFLRNLSFIYVSPLLNSPLRMGELTAGFVPRILYRGSSLKLTSFISSNSHYPSSLQVRTARSRTPGTDVRKPPSSVAREVGQGCRLLKSRDLTFRYSSGGGNDIVGYAIFLEFFGDPDLFFITTLGSALSFTFG